MITSCTGCGACCRNQPYPPFLWEEDDMPPADVRQELLAAIMSHARSEDEPCLWLTPDGKCSRYDERPLVCREMEVGGEDCLYVREVYGIDPLC